MVITCADCSCCWPEMHADLVWNVVNGAGVPLRLFKTTWVNPLPSTPIISIDYVSAMQDSAPFVIAITADE